MLFNSETKTWEYAGGVSGISRVHVYHNNLDNLYRIEGRRLDDSQVSLMNVCCLLIFVYFTVGRALKLIFTHLDDLVAVI